MATINLKYYGIKTKTITTPYYGKNSLYAFKVKGAGASGCCKVGITSADMSITFIDPTPASIGVNLTSIPVGDDDYVDITAAEFDAFRATAKTFEANN